MQDAPGLKSRYDPIHAAENGQSSHHLLPKEMSIPDDSAVEAELARIETADLSDVEGPGFEREKQEYLQRGRKRAIEVEKAETEKRKVCFYSFLYHTAI